MTTTLPTEIALHNGQDLPPGWEWTTLGQIQRDEGQTVVPNRTPDQPYELYSVPSFDNKAPKILFGKDIGSNKQTVSENTVLLCKINPRINRVWVVGSYTQWTKIASTEWIPFPKTDGVEPNYLRYYMTMDNFRDYLSQNASGVGGSLMRIKASTFKNYPFPLPPLAEQGRIVTAIEEQFTQLDAGVAALKSAQAKLRRYRASVLKAACEGSLVPQDPSDEPASVLLERILAERRAQWEAEQLAKMEAQGKKPLLDTWKAKYVAPTPPNTERLPGLPAGWVWASVEQLAAHEPRSITDGPFGSNLKTEHYTDAGPRVIRLQNVGDGKFIDEKAHISNDHFAKLNKHQVFAGDLVIAALGESLPRACIVPDFVGQAIVKADCIRFKPHSSFVDGRYVNTALNSEVVKKAAQRIVHGIGRPRLNQQEIKSLPIPFPPLAEQQRIVAEVERRLSVVDEMDAVIAANLKRAERLRQSILKQAFAGKLVPQDPSDEPAGMLLERIRAEREAASKQNGKRGARQMSLPGV